MIATRPALPPVPVALAFAAYLALALGLHAWVGAEHVWEVAALMMVLMTVTYPAEALLQRRHFVREGAIALGLSAFAIAGVWLSPLLIIGAIFAHGLLDLAKRRGFGVGFYPIYLFSCAAFDVAYAVLLLFHFIKSGGLG